MLAYVLLLLLVFEHGFIQICFGIFTFLKFFFLIWFHARRPATLLKRNSRTGVFLWILRNFKEHLTEHLRTTASAHRKNNLENFQEFFCLQSLWKTTEPEIDSQFRSSHLWLLICWKTKLEKKLFFLKKYLSFLQNMHYLQKKMFLYGKKVL